MNVRARIALIVLLPSLVLAAWPPAATGAELEPRTVRAWDDYVQKARQTFIARARDVSAAARLPDGQVTAGAAHEDGIVGVPGGLLHHWIGRAFIRGATLERALDVSRAYASYADIYESVIAARVLARDGDTFRVLMRLEEGEAGVKATLDVRSTVIYSRPQPRVAMALSTADEIREVENAGRPGERLLPAGRDSGYLWRAATFTYLREETGGLYVEMETLGLSREFPRLLGWLLEPIARRLGRKSVEGSLKEFLTAVRGTAAR